MLCEPGGKVMGTHTQIEVHKRYEELASVPSGQLSLTTVDILVLCTPLLVNLKVSKN